MNVCIITEGFTHTGYGHITRCKAIADGLSLKKNVKTTFIINGDDNAEKLLQDYQYVRLDWINEEEELCRVISTYDIAIIDSYLAEPHTYYMISENISSCIYIDDYNRIDYPIGIIVNGTIGAEKINYNKVTNRNYLLGKEYIILRDAFAEIDYTKKISKNINNILITFGGSDPLDLTSKVLPILSRVFPNSKKNVVLGVANNKIKKLTKTDDLIQQFYNVDAASMKELMTNADIAISAAGQTINELAICGLPSVIFKVADNQENNINGWINTGFIDCFIDATQNWSENTFELYLQQLNSQTNREQVANKGKSAIDNKGVERIIKEIVHSYISANLKLKEATENDLLALFELANEKDVRQNSFSSNKIPINEHKLWFNGLLKNPLKVLFVFEIKNEFVGQIRFDLKEENAIVSISVMPAYRGYGIGTYMIAMAINKLKSFDFKIKNIFAYVKTENKTSQKMFLNVGFSKCRCEKEDSLKYCYTYE